ncbi:unnamed protein product [Sphagnum troendelagicum]|uniref:Uncharacterized protein n=1 Tax=Sphagnum troendelagicum TaxID=128251 RepID=A0ABP0TNC1_9BRYO
MSGVCSELDNSKLLWSSSKDPERSNEAFPVKMEILGSRRMRNSTLWTNGEAEPTFCASQRIVLAGGLQFLIKGGQRSYICCAVTVFSCAKEFQILAGGLSINPKHTCYYAQNVNV